MIYNIQTSITKDLQKYTGAENAIEALKDKMAREVAQTIIQNYSHQITERPNQNAYQDTFGRTLSILTEPEIVKIASNLNRLKDICQTREAEELLRGITSTFYGYNFETMQDKIKRLEREIEELKNDKSK